MKPLVVSIRVEMGAKGVENMVFKKLQTQTNRSIIFFFGTQGQIFFSRALHDHLDFRSLSTASAAGLLITRVLVIFGAAESG